MKMKRSINVKEKELIDRLNNNLNPRKEEYQAPCATTVCVVPAEGPDYGVTTVYKNGEIMEETEPKRTVSRPLSEKEKRLIDILNGVKDNAEKKDTRLRTPDKYEEVNHPQHYNNYDVEVITMMERIFGKEETAIFCKLNAFKYRMRAGTKPGQDTITDLQKEKWYLDKKKELEQK